MQAVVLSTATYASTPGIFSLLRSDLWSRITLVRLRGRLGSAFPMLSKQLLSALVSLNHSVSKRINSSNTSTKKKEWSLPKPEATAALSLPARASQPQRTQLSRAQRLNSFLHDVIPLPPAASLITPRRIQNGEWARMTVKLRKCRVHQPIFFGAPLTMLTSPPSADMPTLHAYRALLPQRGWLQTWLRESHQTDDTESPIGGSQNRTFQVLRRT